MNILLTGAHGFIGSAIKQSLKSATVYTIGRSQTFLKAGNDFSLNLTNTDHISDLITELQSAQIDTIIHTAAITPHTGHTDFTVDLQMAEQMCVVASELKTKPRFFYTSGWNVYSPQNTIPYTEDSPLNPSTDYGRSKLAVETYFKKNLTKNIYINMRLASIYGPGQKSPGLIPTIVRRSLKGEDIHLRSQSTRRDYLFIHDLTTIIDQLLKNTFQQSIDINLGSGSSYSVREIMDTVAIIFLKRFNKKLYYSFDSHSDVPIDNRLDITSLKQMTNFKKFTPLQNSLENYILWMSKQNV